MTDDVLDCFDTCPMRLGYAYQLLSNSVQYLFFCKFFNEKLYFDRVKWTMPRYRALQEEPRRLFGYSKLALKNGLHLCQRGRSLRSAARETGVLRTTLRRKLLGVNGKSHGRPTALSQTEEDILVEGLIVCGDWGFPMTSDDVCDLVQQYLIA